MIRITAKERAYYRKYAMETGVGDLTAEQYAEVNRIADKMIQQGKERIERRRQREGQENTK